jgi:hypothetical protein
MADFTLYFDCERAADAGKLEKELEAGLQQFSTVASAATSKSTGRFTGLELLAGITLAASILHQGASITHDVQKLIKDLRVIIEEVSGLTQKLGIKKVSVPVGMEPKPVDQLTDDDYQVIAQDIIKARKAAASA